MQSYNLLSTDDLSQILKQKAQEKRPANQKLFPSSLVALPTGCPKSSRLLNAAIAISVATSPVVQLLDTALKYILQCSSFPQD